MRRHVGACLLQRTLTAHEPNKQATVIFFGGIKTFGQSSVISFLTTGNTGKYINSYFSMFNYEQMLVTSAGSSVNIPLDMLNVILSKMFQLIGASLIFILFFFFF